MRRIRVIPILLLKNGGLYKTIRFKDALYIGDPINAVKIFNEKGADELFLLDITASAERKPPNFAEIAGICRITLPKELRNDFTRISSAYSV